MQEEIKNILKMFSTMCKLINTYSLEESHNSVFEGNGDSDNLATTFKKYVLQGNIELSDWK